MEHTKRIIEWELLFIFVFAVLIVINSNGMFNVTGRATQDTIAKESILKDLEDVVPQLTFLKDVEEGSLCLIVNINPTTKYSYEIIKVAGVTAVTSSSDLYCKGVDKEDFIISYISYDKLKEQLIPTVTFAQLRSTSAGANFYVYPSKQVLPGLLLANPSEFNQKFGAFLKKNFNAQEIQQILNPKQAEGRLASPIISYLFYFIVGVVVLVVLIVTIIFTHTKKPEIKENLELVSYIKASLSQGYQEEQIRQALSQGGWSAEQIDEAFKTANSMVSEPPTFA